MKKTGLNTRDTVIVSSVVFMIVVFFLVLRFEDIIFPLSSIASTMLMVPVAITYLIVEHSGKKMNVQLERELNYIKESLENLNQKQQHIEQEMNTYLICEGKK